MVWASDDHDSLANGTSGQFFSPFMILLRARKDSRRASSISVQALAMRSRNDGSSSAPGLTERAASTTARRSAERMEIWLAMPTRS